ncbi:MAG: FHA domain-containing protein [Lachnospiraceae bacterium]|nr:FHA domain-containing protein [Lachnospiraceae bacterium]
MGKRVIQKIKIYLLLIVAVFMTDVELSVLAASVQTGYVVEQAKGEAPHVKAYMTGAKMSKETEVSGMVGEYELKQDGNIQTFKESGEGIFYIIMVDNSGSVNEAQLEEVKLQLAEMRKNLRENDKFLLYTVGANSSTGEKTNVLERTVVGKEQTKLESDIQKIEEIEFLYSAESRTVLYRTLNQVLTEHTAEDMRTVALIITDGEDDSEGKDIDAESTADKVAEAAIPVYGIVLHNDAREPNEEKMRYTRYEVLAEENSRGYYEDCSTVETTEEVTEAFKNMQDVWMNQSYVVNLAADTNKILLNPQLSIVADNQAANAINIDYSKYVKDENPPIIVGNVKQISGNTLSVSIEDVYGINQLDVSDPSHYVLQMKTEEGDGKTWTVESARAVQDGNVTVVTLTCAEELYKNQEYTLKCSDIHDESQDANVMNVSLDFTTEIGVNEAQLKKEAFLENYSWLAVVAVALVLLMILVIIIIVIVRKKNVKVVDLTSEDFLEVDTQLIRLTITDRVGAIKDVEWNVEGSLFIGRSDICNIYFDDDRLSKQHFVIEVTKMGCYIEDLETTNGTFVNGVKLSARRMLLDGDIITAGREKFVFHMPKNGPDISQEYYQ